MAVSDILDVVKSGARKNKYRVTVPILGSLSNDIDILCHTATLPAKTLTPTELIMKGRKYMLRGEMTFDSSWEMTIYNTEDMQARKYFLQWIEDVMNTSMDAQGLLGGLSVGGISLGEASRAITGAVSIASNLGENPLSLLGGLQADYQRDIRVEQLNSNGEVEAQAILIGAFPTSVGAVDYDDSTGEVSTCTITFAYTDIQTKNDLEQIGSAVLGDSTTSLAGSF